MSIEIMLATRWLETATYVTLGSTVALCVTLSLNSLPNSSKACSVEAVMAEKASPDGSLQGSEASAACMTLAGTVHAAQMTGHTTAPSHGLHRVDLALDQPAKLELASMPPQSATAGDLGDVVMVWGTTPALEREWLPNALTEGVAGEANGPLSSQQIREGQGLGPIAAVVLGLLLMALIRRSFVAQKAQAREVADDMAKLERSATENTTKLCRELAALRLHAAHVDATLEALRIRVAEDLHDELGSILTALKFELSDGSDDAWQAGVKRRASADLVDTAMQSARRLIATVQPYPLQRAGLWEALNWKACEFEKTWGIPCRVLMLEDLPWPSRKISTAAFRIVEEGLTNARHANATKVDILVQFMHSRLLIDVSHSERCVPNDMTHLGTDGSRLIGIRERARAVDGTITFLAHSDLGTIMRFMVRDQVSKERPLFDEVQEYEPTQGANCR